MKKPSFYYSALAAIGLLVTSACSTKNNNSLGDLNTEIQSFIFNGLDVYYLYRDDVSAFERNFRGDANLSPRGYFEELRSPEDRFSFIYHDYEVLEALFAGVRISSGITYDLFEDNGSYIAAVLHVDEDSPADLAGVKRGDYITHLNGSALDSSQTSFLTNETSYELTLAQLEANTNGFVTRTTVTINEGSFEENAVSTYTIIENGGKKVGYILYNSFIRGSEIELNSIFGEFVSAGVDELVLDLRYNGGGSINTAKALSQMITGDYTGEILFKEQWNEAAQDYWEMNDSEAILGRFADTFTYDDTTYDINALHLDRLYVLSSKDRTASASELIINSLSAYIDVVHIGEATGTVGKSQASTTLYDSDNFTKENINTRHKYVMQPLIYQSVNANNASVPNDGLTPEISYSENYLEIEPLGDPSEGMLQLALQDMDGGTLAKTQQRTSPFVKLGGNAEDHPFAQEMYDDSVRIEP